MLIVLFFCGGGVSPKLQRVREGSRFLLPPKNRDSFLEDYEDGSITLNAFYLLPLQLRGDILDRCCSRWPVLLQHPFCKHTRALCCHSFITGMQVERERWVPHILHDHQCVCPLTPPCSPPPPHLWPAHSSSSLPAVHLTSCSALSRPCLWTHQACFPVVTQEERYWLRGEGVRFPPRVCRLLYLSHGEQLQQQF